MKAGQSRALLCFWRGAEETKQEKEEREKSEVEEEKTKKKKLVSTLSISQQKENGFVPLSSARSCALALVSSVFFGRYRLYLPYLQKGEMCANGARMAASERRKKRTNASDDVDATPMCELSFLSFPLNSLLVQLPIALH
jgi:hypothetical protein